MKTFLKIVLLALLVYVVIKISPALFVFAVAGLLIAGALGAIGLSLLVVLAAVGVGLVVALAPIWLPVLLVIGLISLFRRNGGTPPVMEAH
jgi:hypothetical protein